MLLLKLMLVFLGPFFGLAVRDYYKKMYNASYVEAQPPGLDWGVFLFALTFWYALLCATEFLL